MNEENATTTFVIAEPFERAVKLVRKALSGMDLRITGELNMSERIQRRLLIRTAPCIVLFASPNIALEDVPESGEASLTPLHVVVSGRGSQTEVHLLKVLPRPDSSLDRRTVKVSGQLQSMIVHAMETIGMRAPLGV